MAGVDQLKVGDVIRSLSGPGVTWPYGLFRYRVISVDIKDGKVGLEIVQAQE